MRKLRYNSTDAIDMVWKIEYKKRGESKQKHDLMVANNIAYVRSYKTFIDFSSGGVINQLSSCYMLEHACILARLSKNEN